MPPFVVGREHASYPPGTAAITGYRPEGWHFRYVGRDAAAEIHGAGWSVEEYFQHHPPEIDEHTCYVIDGRTGEVKDQRLFLEPERHWGALFYARNPARREVEHGCHLWQTYWGLEPSVLATSHVQMYRDHPYRVVSVERLSEMRIPSTIPGTEIHEAMRYLETMRACGKVVLSVPGSALPSRRDG